jgi:hypothetical protein
MFRQRAFILASALVLAPDGDALMEFAFQPW